MVLEIFLEFFLGCQWSVVAFECMTKEFLGCILVLRGKCTIANGGTDIIYGLFTNSVRALQIF